MKYLIFLTEMTSYLWTLVGILALYALFRAWAAIRRSLNATKPSKWRNAHHPSFYEAMRAIKSWPHELACKDVPSTDEITERIKRWEELCEEDEDCVSDCPCEGCDHRGKCSMQLSVRAGLQCPNFINPN